MEAEALLREWVKMVNDEDHKHFPTLLGKVNKYFEGKYTQRGFEIYDQIKDSKNQDVRVQLSSAAGEPCCWVFCHNAEGKDAYEHLGELHAVSPHLTIEQAVRLATALLKFVAGSM